MTDKLIVFFTNVKNLFVDNTAQNEEFSYTLRNVSLHNAAKGNTVAISAYYVDGSSDPLQNIDRLEQLVKQNIVSNLLSMDIDISCYLHEPHREWCPSN